MIPGINFMARGLWNGLNFLELASSLKNSVSRPWVAWLSTTTLYALLGEEIAWYLTLEETNDTVLPICDTPLCPILRLWQEKKKWSVASTSHCTVYRHPEGHGTITNDAQLMQKSKQKEHQVLQSYLLASCNTSSCKRVFGKHNNWSAIVEHICSIVITYHLSLISFMLSWNMKGISEMWHYLAFDWLRNQFNLAAILGYNLLSSHATFVPWGLQHLHQAISH